MKKQFFILLLVLVILILFWFLFTQKFINPNEKKNQIIRILNSSNCTMVPGETISVFGAVWDSDNNFSQMEQLCETSPSCEMRQQGCRVSIDSMGPCSYTCCPKDLYILDTSNPYGHSIVNSKYADIVKENPGSPLNACFLYIN